MAQQENKKLKKYGKIIGANLLQRRGAYLKSISNKEEGNPDIEEAIDKYLNK